jgi:hypothetical protein
MRLLLQARYRTAWLRHFMLPRASCTQVVSTTLPVVSGSTTTALPRGRGRCTVGLRTRRGPDHHAPDGRSDYRADRPADEGTGDCPGHGSGGRALLVGDSDVRRSDKRSGERNRDQASGHGRLR